jgi:hypothetical protein
VRGPIRPIELAKSLVSRILQHFPKIECDVIARGVFTSVADLKRKLTRDIREYNNAPKPVKWKYHDGSKRITVESSVIGH